MDVLCRLVFDGVGLAEYQALSDQKVNGWLDGWMDDGWLYLNHLTCTVTLVTVDFHTCRGLGESLDILNPNNKSSKVCYSKTKKFVKV